MGHSVYLRAIQARIGPMIAPYISDLKQYNARAHLAVYGLMALFAG